MHFTKLIPFIAQPIEGDQKYNISFEYSEIWHTVSDIF